MSNLSRKNPRVAIQAQDDDLHQLWNTCYLYLNPPGVSQLSRVTNHVRVRLQVHKLHGFAKVQPAMREHHTLVCSVKHNHHWYLSILNLLGVTTFSTCLQGQVCCPSLFGKRCPNVPIPTVNIPGMQTIQYNPIIKTAFNKFFFCVPEYRSCGNNLNSGISKWCTRTTCNTTTTTYYCEDTTATQRACADGLVCCTSNRQIACSLVNTVSNLTGS